MHKQISEQQLIHEFLKDLENLPGVRADLLSENSQPAHLQINAEIDLKLAGKPLKLLVEAKKMAYPRDVQQMIWQLRKAGREPNSNKGRILVVIAEFLSPGAKQLLEAEHIGYYESGGSLYLPAPGAYIYIDKPPAKAFKRSVRSLFSGGEFKLSTHCLFTMRIGLVFTNWHTLQWCRRLQHPKCCPNWSALIG